mmetsp:Transcript_38096/g.111591  ORF Transcript_38096/g.111591 Transcript_38096/m.111591 type:complete len:97 (+) Transcript_38096:321-611(+)|eukprot:2729824-Prymnesium_polylepis.4
MFRQFYVSRGFLWVGAEMHCIPLSGDEIPGLVPGESPREEQWWFCIIFPFVANEGTRPMSKVACRLSEALLAEWRSKIRKYVADFWIHKQQVSKAS